MSVEKKTNSMSSNLVTQPSTAEPATSNIAALYYMLSSSPDAAVRKIAATDLLKLIDEGEDIELAEIAELFKHERDISVFTELKRVMNKLRVRKHLILGTTSECDGKLPSDEEPKI